jgi:RimJ/RimL family protein N-acetyltransferase
VQPTDQSSFVLRRLRGSDAQHFRSLRLEGLCSCPEAFAASWDAEVLQPIEWFRERLERNVVFGGWRDASTLVGVAGLHVSDAAKSSHKGKLWGMFVLPEARGAGLATALLTHIIEHAKSVVEEIHLSVVTTNSAAVRLYARAGFIQFGLEQRGLKVDDRYYDELLMALQLRPPR